MRKWSTWMISGTFMTLQCLGLISVLLQDGALSTAVQLPRAEVHPSSNPVRWRMVQQPRGEMSPITSNNVDLIDENTMKHGN